MAGNARCFVEVTAAVIVIFPRLGHLFRRGRQEMNFDAEVASRRASQ